MNDTLEKKEEKNENSEKKKEGANDISVKKKEDINENLEKI